MPVLKPFLAGPSTLVTASCHNGRVFAEDFWMEDRLGAMVGASVRDYAYASAAHQPGGTPAHMRVVGQDIPGADWPFVMTSAADCGWVDGSGYAFDPDKSDPENTAAWVAAGCPSRNAHGEWGAAGYPMEYIRWTWLNPKTRGPSPLRPHQPGRGRRKRG